MSCSTTSAVTSEERYDLIALHDWQWVINDIILILNCPQIYPLPIFSLTFILQRQNSLVEKSKVLRAMFKSQLDSFLCFAGIAIVLPPLVDIHVGLGDINLLMEECAHTAKELGVHFCVVWLKQTKFANLVRPLFPAYFPAEVFVVQCIVVIQLVQVLGKVLGTIEVIHMDEGVLGGNLLVVLTRRSHHNRKDVVPDHCKWC